jgi:diguanylate cyclase (GGDEF)-like protein
MAHAFVNAEAEPVFRVVAMSEVTPIGQWRDHPDARALTGEIRQHMRGLSVVKVKLYNRRGSTVFSTESAQIGEDRSGNAGLLAALRGEITSTITRRDRFDAFEGVINNRDLIATYVPVRRGDAGDVEAVFELYSDVTELLARQTRAQWETAAIALGLQVALYLFLLMVVRRADRLLQHHERQRARREAEIRYQAQHDVLTGLPNRASFAERLGQVTAQARRPPASDARSALMFVDLDRFKLVNDSFGHDVGDRLLQEVARRFQSCLLPGEQLFRMGGDEFTVLMPSIRSPEEAAHRARRLQAVLVAPIALSGHEMSVGASIGIAVCPDDGTEAEDLVRRADAAMYGAKSLGRGVVAFYRDEMNQRALQRLELEAALKHAVRAAEFVLHFQPRMRASDGRVVALEALLRWQRPGHGLVLPGDFMATLEDMPLMQAVGEWVLRAACAQLVRWHARGRPDLRVSVNVAAVQLESPGFPDVVRAALAAAGVPAQCLELEVTETSMMRYPERSAAVLTALRASGVRIAIDDFGTGHSSLQRLRTLPVDVLKVDRSFVAGLAHSGLDRALVGTIVGLGRALGVTVVAEGVETEAQAAIFRDLGAHELQGFLLARPAAPEDLDRWVMPGTAAVANAPLPSSAGGLDGAGEAVSESME